MALHLQTFHRRQNAIDDDDDEIIIDDGRGFWYSRTAYIIKWSIIAAAMLLSLLIVLAYLHAQRRMRKGLPPLAYHKWLVRRRDRMQFDPAYRNQYMGNQYPNQMYNGYQNADAMNGYALNQPGPVYGNAPGSAAGYMPPPDGFSKVNPDQNGPVGVPPPGAPTTRSEDTLAFPTPVAGNTERERL